MSIPAEPIGSIPRTPELLAAFRDKSRIPAEEFDRIAEHAVLDTIPRFEETGSPVITDGEQTKPTFATYPIHGLSKRFTALPIKQAVISASALSLLYPGNGIPGYSRDAFLSDLVNEAVTDIRQCFLHGADSVQIDFTEGRLSLKLDPSGGLLRNFGARALTHRCPYLSGRRSGRHA